MDPPVKVIVVVARAVLLGEMVQSLVAVNPPAMVGSSGSSGSRTVAEGCACGRETDKLEANVIVRQRGGHQSLRLAMHRQP